MTTGIRAAFIGILDIGLGVCILSLTSTTANAWQEVDSTIEKTPKVVRLPEVLPELVTDRPDYTEATSVVGRGVIQTEMGMTVDREGSAMHMSQGELLVRIGVTKRIELRLGGEGLSSLKDSSVKSDGRWRRGLSDSEVGLKISLWEEKQYLPAFSVIPILSMPTGGQLFSSGSREPTVKLAWSKDLVAGFTLGSNVNFSSLQAESGRLFQRAYSASVGHSLVSGFSGYWEVFRFAPWGEGTNAAWIANTGITHGVGRNAQLDVRVGKRMTSEGPNWFFGLGFAFRQPTRLFAR